MNRKALIGLVLLGGVFLASGCCRPYHRGYPTAHAARTRPGAFWTGVGLHAAGDTALVSAAHQSSPGGALAALAVGAGLHAAASGCFHRAAYGSPCERRVTYRYDRYGRCHRTYTYTR